jgi:hypothetical protein
VLPWIFCNSTEHRSRKCPKSIKQRTESYTLHVRCRRCSKKGHLTKECDVVCKNCWDPHHIFLCPKISEPLAAKSSGGSAKSGKSGDTGEKGKRETWAWTCLSSSNDFQPSATNLLDHGKGTLRPMSSAGSTRRGGGICPTSRTAQRPNSAWSQLDPRVQSVCIWWRSWATNDAQGKTHVFKKYVFVSGNVVKIVHYF